MLFYHVTLPIVQRVPLVFAPIVSTGMRLHKVPADRENNGAVVGNKMYCQS